MCCIEQIHVKMQNVLELHYWMCKEEKVKSLLTVVIAGVCVGHVLCNEF